MFINLPHQGINDQKEISQETGTSQKEDWSRFLPMFKKKRSKESQAKLKKNKTKRRSHSIPTTQRPRKIDWKLKVVNIS